MEAYLRTRGVPLGPLGLDARSTLSRYDALDKAGAVAQPLEQRTHETRNPFDLF
jgi:hypothetical protein